MGLKEKFRKHPTISITFSLIILLIIILGLGEWFYFDLFKPREDQKIINLHSASIIILTLLLVWVAWIQLYSLNNINKADFLLRIDDRFGSDQIIKARTIIHKFYCESRSEEICQETHIKKISERIKEIGTNSEKADDFVCLLNFLDFLETISYFANNNYLSKRDVQELIAESLTFYYKVFEPWIYYRRQKYSNDNFYREVENLVKDINKT